MITLSSREPLERTKDQAGRVADLAQDHAFVVLAYKQSPFLSGCLASLATQTLKSRIVVATSTPSPFIDSAAAAHGPVIVNPVCAGIGSDFNFALRASDARFVTLVHQDDTYAPEFLQRSLGEFAQHSEGVLCFTGYVEIDDEGRTTRSKVSIAKHLMELLALGPLHVVRGLPLWAFLAFGDPLPCSSVTFDLSKLPDFAFSLKYAANLDWDAWWRLREEGHTFLRAPWRLVGRRHNEFTETSELLRSGVRRTEDLAMFRRAWPRPVADVIAMMYRLGY